MDRQRHARDPAVEPPAEPERLPARRCATGKVTRVFRDESTTWVDVGRGRALDRRQPGVPVDQRARRLAARLPRAARRRATATLITRFDADITDARRASTRRTGGCISWPRRRNATQGYLYRSQLDGRGAPERVTPADQPGTHSYVLAPGRPPRVPHVVALRHAAGDRHRRRCRRTVRCAR